MEIKRILFFDDEKFITELIIENLQKNYGWLKEEFGEITYVQTPKELFEKAEDKRIKYDLFVLDIMVPIDQINQIEKPGFFSEEEIDRMQEGDNTGVVFAEKLRSMPNYTNVPILFLSARIQPSQMMENTDYLEKPPFAEVVSEKMKKMLKIS